MSGSVLTKMKSTGLIGQVGVIALVALAAELTSRLLGGLVSPIMIGLVAGLAARHFLTSVDRLGDGIEVVAGKILRIGIAFIGLRITLGALLEPGGTALAIALGGVLLVTVLATMLGPKLTQSSGAWILLAVGTAICGNSAIIATAPVIEARQREVALAVGLVTAFGTLALFAYPLIGAALGMDQATFGLWAGTGINDTAQVVAAGEAYGPEAAATAVTVKFVRNLLILPVVGGLALVFSRRQDRQTNTAGKLPWLRALPPFVLGFIAMSAVATLGWLSPELENVGRLVSTGFITAGMVAIGLKTRLADARTLGWAPLGLGLALSLALSGFSFLMVTLTT